MVPGTVTPTFAKGNALVFGSIGFIPTVATVKLYHKAAGTEPASLLGETPLPLSVEETKTTTLPLTFGTDVSLAIKAVNGCGSVTINYTVAAVEGAQQQANWAQRRRVIRALSDKSLELVERAFEAPHLAGVARIFGPYCMFAHPFPDKPNQ